ncbi:orotidine-5'-phosphate decarboxylase [Candidatus Pacearchaeota archaeon]|nr:orotidine-5'-phosphate decarboxylase [Candidatus Pacearchaeota archaeon]
MKKLSDRLLDKIDSVGNPCIVGLDPVPEKLPPYLLRGDSFEDIARAFRDFNFSIIDSIADIVGIVKPQIAFYEKYSAPGLQAFKDTVEYAHSYGLIVIEDGKRADISSTSEAYAQGHLGIVNTGRTTQPSLNVDLLTINPYLGTDGLDPFITACRDHDKGVFILVKTSNPSSSQFQDRLVLISEEEERLLISKGLKVEGNHTPLYNLVANQVNSYAVKHIGKRGYSSIGAVVGAPFPEQAKILRKLMPQSIFLVPGYGQKQGGTAKDVVNCFNQDGYGAVINSSSSIDFAWQFENNPNDFAGASRRATQRMIYDINNALKDAGKLPKGWGNFNKNAPTR